MERCLRVLELYSGIGGMHHALRESRIDAEVVAAVDVNTIANEVYKHNFPTTPLWPKTIEGITLQELNRLDFDMILMSPPCQPFTRIGLQGDVADPRAKSFLYVLDILPRLERLPKYILLENVKGFEDSSARNVFLQTLEKCGFQYQEFLLSPTCLGIPNSRLRYFLIAKLLPEPFSFQTSSQILTEFPNPEGMCLQERSVPMNLDKDWPFVPAEETKMTSKPSRQYSEQGPFLFKLETPEDAERKKTQNNDISIQMLQVFLEDGAEDLSQYFLPPKSLLRYALLLDIVKPTSRRSTCFTKGYGHYVEGTGSVLQSAEDVEMESVFKLLETLSEEEKLKRLSTLQLRYFTPREIAKLHGFPQEFSFPDKTTVKQRYRLLGNSLNVHIVAKLITALLI
ncbi:tRNA (cytosine(38)-C(5))-methyltransferase isoform X1 [Microcaecilia unicolor]|uniref:tRNA (Cytosine(38)-C(5))-methyltransferase isoform X1 n=1 Tax=Microcaecilia unicolor TaxID=1415580 RepID=A0A6P7XXJ5_9AMPH|nr:tRNA (cytosine(38)-C(5))-methyltransferase isoform X1 [Microcaecilia unicolor]